MSDEQTLAEVHQLGLSYITGLPPSTQIALLEGIHETSPDLFDQPLSEYIHKDGQRFILCRHHQKGYRKQAQNHRKLRTVYQELKKIQASPQNYNQQKLYHRAIKVLETHRQTKFWELSFQAYPGRNGKDRYRLIFRLDRCRFQAQNIIGHYYVLQTDLPKTDLPGEHVNHSYKSLFRVERCFRQVKSDLEIRPIRHRKATRIRAHIYLNFLCLWLLKQIEKNWRAAGITCKVAAKLKQWDRRMMLHELLDEQTSQLIELQWNQGPVARQTFREVQEFGEMGTAPSHL